MKCLPHTAEYHARLAALSKAPSTLDGWWHHYWREDDLKALRSSQIVCDIGGAGTVPGDSESDEARWMAERLEARNRKDWKTADELRDRFLLFHPNGKISDTREGTRFEWLNW